MFGDKIYDSAITLLQDVLVTMSPDDEMVW